MIDQENYFAVIVQMPNKKKADKFERTIRKKYGAVTREDNNILVGFLTYDRAKKFENNFLNEFPVTASHSIVISIDERPMPR